MKTSVQLWRGVKGGLALLRSAETETAGTPCTLACWFTGANIGWGCTH